MAIGGIILLASYAILMFAGKKTRSIVSFQLLVMTVCVSLFINVGMSLFKLSYTHLAEYILLMYILYDFMTEKNYVRVSRNFIVRAILLLLCIVIGDIHLIISNDNPVVVPFSTTIDSIYHSEEAMSVASFTNNNVIYLRWMIIFIIIVYFSTKVLDDSKKRLRFISTIKIVFEVFFFIWTLEWLINNLTSPSLVRQTVYGVFGVNEASKTYNVIIRWGFYGFNGLFTEPSYITIMSVYYSILWKYKMQSWKDWFCLIWSLIVLVINGSTSGAMLIPFWVIIVLKNFSGKVSKRAMEVIGMAVVLSIILSLIFYDSIVLFLNQVMTNLSAYFSGGSFKTRGETSAAIRQLGNNIAYQTFLKRPLFGVGFGTTRGYGVLPGTLACLGIMGTLSYLYFLIGAYKCKINKDNAILAVVMLFYSTAILNIWYLNCAAVVPICIVLTFKSKWINLSNQSI